MRNTLLLIFITVFQAYADDTYSQNTKLSLNSNNVTVASVLEKIQNNSEFYFLFNAKLIDVDREVSISVKDIKISEILTSLFSGTGVNWVVYDRQIILTPSDVTALSDAMQQQQKVTGTVTDKDGNPLPGVNVVITGTTVGVVTDIAGKYSIDVPQGSQSLTFSFIGMEPQIVNIGTSAIIDVTMAASEISLGEVVVTGYGVQQKVNLTGAVSTVKFNEEIANRPITNASQALGGLTTGLWVSQNSGQPGKDEAMIRVRGWGTLNNSNPLILIDGIEGAMSNVNPSDIETVTVLKDASSAAIYGSRAANGVVLITTKGGTFNEGIEVTYSGYYGLQKIGQTYDLINNSVEHMELWNESVVLSGGDPVFPQDVIEAFRTGTNPFVYPNTDWFKEVTKVAAIMEHNLSMTSGSKNSKNYFSVNYLDHEGIWLNTNSNRYTMTFNNETKLNKWVNIGGKFNLMHKTTSEPYNGINRAVYMLANGRPYEAPYTEDGRFGGPQALYVSGPKIGQPIVDSRNPMPDLYNGLMETSDNFFKGNVFTNIQLTEGLNWNTQYSGQYDNKLYDRWNEILWGYTSSGIKVKPLDFPSNVSLQRNVADNFSQTFYSTLNYSKNIAGIHSIEALAGMQVEDFTWKTINASKSDPPKEGLHQVSSGTTSAVADGNRNQLRMLSYFGRLNYAYRSKYLAEFNFRADASSRFNKANRWGYFPSASIGWRLSEEEFLQNGFFDELKLRASYGELGNQNLAGYWPYLITITQDYGTSYNVADALASGAAITKLSDENISWETTTSSDLGLDVRILNDRLTVELDYFTKETNGILVQLPMLMLMGSVTPPYENIGIMRNNGFEISLNWRDEKSRVLTYFLGVNLTYIKNKVVKFKENAPDQLYLIREGYSYQTLYGYSMEGVYQTDDEALVHMHANGYKPKAGDIKFVDMNSDGKLDFEDKSELGNTIPKYTFGVNGGVSYKGIDLKLLFQGIAGAHAYSYNAFTQPLGISGATITERWRERWTPTNPSTEIPRIVMNDTWNTQQSSFWVNDLNWIKLKNIQLGYTLPFNGNNLGLVKNAYVYLNGQNVLTLINKDYEGFDPEKNTFSSGYSDYPTARVFSIGVNLTF